MKVALLPVGELPHGLLQGLADRLARFGIVGEVRTQVRVPSHPSGTGSTQLRAEALLRLASDRSVDIWAVTGKDLCAEGYDFVFGYANVGSSGSVVSVARLGHPNPDHLLDRIVKEALHELGHTWDLEHCELPGCVMRHSESIADADAKGEAFCDNCRGRLSFALERPRTDVA